MWRSFLLVAFSVGASAQMSGTWLSPPPTVLEVGKGPEFPPTSFQEVAVHGRAKAQSLLANTAAYRLTRPEAQSFTNGQLHCAPTETPYLVRALIGNRGTGHFFIHRSENVLLVFHGSLGHSSAPSQTALVVCLAFRPSAVYGSISVAE
jgi:hypothetical protein